MSTMPSTESQKNNSSMYIYISRITAMKFNKNRFKCE